MIDMKVDIVCAEARLLDFGMPKISPIGSWLASITRTDERCNLHDVIEVV